jgi:hypothetical protein
MGARPKKPRGPAKKILPAGGVSVKIETIEGKTQSA